jgi:hypothetical protein
MSHSFRLSLVALGVLGSALAGCAAPADAPSDTQSSEIAAGFQIAKCTNSGGDVDKSKLDIATVLDLRARVVKQQDGRKVVTELFSVPVPGRPAGAPVDSVFTYLELKMSGGKGEMYYTDGATGEATGGPALPPGVPDLKFEMSSPAGATVSGTGKKLVPLSLEFSPSSATATLKNPGLYTIVLKAAPESSVIRDEGGGFPRLLEGEQNQKSQLVRTYTGCTISNRKLLQTLPATL